MKKVKARKVNSTTKINKPKNKGGRPRKADQPISFQQAFEELCSLQCTLAEFCCFLKIDDKNLENWCKSTYNMGFAEVFALKRGTGKISLRRAQWEKALKTKDTTMQIFLGKQYLDQKDKANVEVTKIEVEYV